MEELEIVPQHQIDGMRIFVNKVEYRSSHFHPEWELMWVLDHPLNITCAQKKYGIQPGELILFPPNWPHEFHEMEHPCTFLCLQISPRVFSTTSHLHTDEMRLASCLPREDDRWLRQAMLETARVYFAQEPHSELFCLGQCALILHRLLKFVPFHTMTAEELAQAEQRNTRLTRLVQYVDENFAHKIRLSDFAQLEGCTVSFLSHFVREAMNQTFQDYVNSVRFNYARKLIILTDKPLVGICYESGFSDYRYFSRSFQSAYGMTPAEYRLHSQSAHAEQLPVESLHSRERICSRVESLEILNRIRLSHEDPPFFSPTDH
ncbi:MAG: helix-turn-helix domain-containing protein [Eubacteriales bacterium]|nr:helix-turn-helix domain-containing protein [Eubacteriales bacterium]